jgi:hypothetical protein
MFKSIGSRARTVAAVGVVAALAVAGVALAQGGSGNGKSQHRKPPAGKRMHPPGGPLGGPLGKDLTYAQVHVQHEGTAQVIRVDRGEVVSTSESSITVKENDGNEVTIAVDGETKVLAGPGRNTPVTDLKAGQEVTVCGPEGGTAKAIMVPPEKGRMPRGPQGSQGQGQGKGQLPPPPPGGQFGGPQGGPRGEGN